MIKKIINIISFLLISIFANAQNTTKVTNNDFMHQDGKIYVVIAVVLIILIGLFFYVWTLDKKISKLEKEN